MNKKISIIIPAYNEEKRIEKSLIKIIDYCKKNFKEYEIIVVDDCSRDKTNEIVSKYNVKILKNEVNKGKGFSVKRGILEAKYPLVLFTDSDLATPIEELGQFIDYTQDHDIVIASRNLKESDIKVEQSFLRHSMGKTFPLLVNFLVLGGIKDTQCGFKLFRTEIAKKIVNLQTFDRFAFDAEILFIAKKLKYKIKEAPVVWIDKEGSTLNPFKDSFKMLFDLFRIRYNDFLGRYKA